MDFGPGIYFLLITAMLWSYNFKIINVILYVNLHHAPVFQVTYCIIVGYIVRRADTNICFDYENALCQIEYNSLSQK